MYRARSFLCLILLIAAVPQTSAAQEYLILPEQIALGGSAYWDPQNPNEIVVLTENTTNQFGTATVLSEICAREFVVDFEVYMGDDTGAAGGALFFLFELNKDDNELSRYGLDTAFDSVLSRDYELNGNHAEVWTCNARYDYMGAPYPSGRGCGPVAATAMQFRMEGAGWLKVRAHDNEGRLAYDLTAASGDSSIIGGTRVYTPQEPVKLHFQAHTGAAHNMHRIRNIKITVLRNDNCAGKQQLSLADAQSQLDTSCGAPNGCAAGRWSCALAFAEQLYHAALITESVRDTLKHAADEDRAYCAGFAEGAASIDAGGLEAAAYQTGFAAGAASIDTAAIEANGYQAGFDAGALSVDVQAIEQQAYEEGFAAGQASVQACPEQAIPICHKHRRTMHVDLPGLLDHLRHGDTVGPC